MDDELFLTGEMVEQSMDFQTTTDMDFQTMNNMNFQTEFATYGIQTNQEHDQFDANFTTIEPNPDIFQYIFECDESNDVNNLEIQKFTTEKDDSNGKVPKKRKASKRGPKGHFCKKLKPLPKNATSSKVRNLVRPRAFYLASSVLTKNIFCGSCYPKISEHFAEILYERIGIQCTREQLCGLCLMNLDEYFEEIWDNNLPVSPRGSPPDYKKPLMWLEKRKNFAPRHQKKNRGWYLTTLLAP